MLISYILVDGIDVQDIDGFDLVLQVLLTIAIATIHETSANIETGCQQIMMPYRF